MAWIVTKTVSVLEALKEFSPESSSNTVRSWIEEGRISVNGKSSRRAKDLVYPSQEIKLGKKKQYMKEGIEILYEDDDIVVVYKPAGVLSVATDLGLEENVHSYLKKRGRGRRVYPVHRLDRDVSGVMIFAYTHSSKEDLKSQFVEHSIVREYIAVVDGSVNPSKGTWQSYLFEDGAYYVRSVPDAERGELATTHYQVISEKRRITTLKVTLETGRKNQIRVHCKEAGCTILGDEKYGSKVDFFGRIALHALKLGIVHKRLMKKMVFEREPDEVFAPYLP